MGLLLKGVEYHTVQLRLSEQEHKSKRFPNLYHRSKVPVLDDDGPSLKDALSRNAFLSGSQATTADAMVYPEIGRMPRANQSRPNVMAVIGFKPLETQYPLLHSWWSRMTLLSHWTKPGHLIGTDCRCV